MDGSNISLQELVSCVEKHPNLFSFTSLSVINQFWQFSVHLRSEIELASTASGPPFRLPLYIHEFLCDALALGNPDAVKLWDCLKDIIWNAPRTAQPYISCQEKELFKLHGSKRGATPATEKICKEDSLFVAFGFQHMSCSTPHFEHVNFVIAA